MKRNDKIKIKIFLRKINGASMTILILLGI